MPAVTRTVKTTRSSFSVLEFNSYLTTFVKPRLPPNRLADAPQINAKRFLGQPQHHKDDPKLPGQRYTADQQCAFFWGRDYRQEIPLGQTKEVKIFI